MLKLSRDLAVGWSFTMAERPVNISSVGRSDWLAQNPKNFKAEPQMNINNRVKLKIATTSQRPTLSSPPWDTLA